MKLLTKTLLLATLIFPYLCPLTLAQEKKEDPIDQALTACMEKNYSTMEMVECNDKAYQNWDKELNRVYNTLNKRLNSSAKNNLQKAQLAWLKYRDSEFNLIASVYSQMQGTMYIPMAAYRRVEIVRNRTLELRDYLDLLNQQ